MTQNIDRSYRLIWDQDQSAILEDRVVCRVLRWTLDPNKDSLHEVILYLKDFADKLFDRTGVAFRVLGLAPELEQVKLSADAKRHLTLICKEGMNNILKHVECRNATLQVEASAGQMRILLRDDGKGCNGNMNGSGYGLKNMRERAEKIHGRLHVNSKLGEGTEIELLAKLSENNPDFAL